MDDVRAMRKLLRSEYGIRTDQQLQKALWRERLDISVFVSSVEECGVFERERQDKPARSPSGGREAS